MNQDTPQSTSPDLSSYVSSAPAQTSSGGNFPSLSQYVKPYDGTQDPKNFTAGLGMTNTINSTESEPESPLSNAIKTATQDLSDSINPIKQVSNAVGIAKGAVDLGQKTLVSAAAMPIDLVRQIFMGKEPMSGTFPTLTDGTPMKTFQADTQDYKTNKIDQGQGSTLEDAMQVVNPVLGGASFLGATGETSSGGSLLEGGINKGLDTAKTAVTNRAEKSAINKSLESVQSTEKTMTKSERLQAIDQGRLKPTSLGGKEFTPSDTEQNAAQILKGKVTGNPVKDVSVIKNEIATRGQEAEDYLAKNSKPISNKDHFDAFDKQRQEASKYLTDSEMKSYDEQVKMFSKQLPGRGGYNTSNYYKALKEYESNIADKLPRGKEALIDPTGIANAKIRAASDVRTVVRDMIGAKNPDFKGKMYDLASLYDAKGNILSKADKLEGNAITRLSKKYPKTTGAAATIGALGVDKTIKNATGFGF